MMKEVNKVKIFFFLHLFLHVSANFDCESSESSSSCSTELRCVYDEAYKGRSNFCTCKIVLNAVSLPGNTLRNSLLETACSVSTEKVQELQINDAELKFIDEHIFDSYKNLKVLNVAGNRIRTNFSSKATGIVELNLKSNELTTLASFKELHRLKILTLSFNRLEELDLFGAFSDLEEVYLNDNRLVIIENDFGGFPKLRLLNLDHNFLVSWGKLTSESLQELYLGHNKLTSLNREDFEKLPKLRILDVSHNLISSLGGGPGNLDIFGKKHVNSLNFQNFGASFQPGQKNSQFNPYKALGASFLQNPNFGQFRRTRRQSGFFLHFGSPPTKQTLRNMSSGDSWAKLQELNLAENRIRSIPGGFFSGLEDLRKLNVSYNDLGTFDFNELSSSLRLIRLDLKSNKLGSLNLEILKDKWILLKVVDFDVDLEKCGDFRDVLSYFKENEVVVKSCSTARGCCGIFFD